MKTALHMRSGRLWLTCLSWLALGAGPAAWAQAGAGGGAAAVYYVCPGNVFTNTIGTKEAEQRGCKAREASQPTTIAGPRRRAAVVPETSTERPADSRVAANEQRARDSDAKRILQAELMKEEEALEALRREYNKGEPERRGDERNAQKYQERVAEIKAALARKEADVNAIRRELAKLPS